MGEVTDIVLLYIKDSSILEDFTNDVAVNLENNIKEEAPYKEGRLRRSIRVDTRISDDHGVVTGTYDEGLAPHADFVLMGTRPHDIYAKPGSALNTPYGLFKKVHHPGTGPNDFLGRGLTATVELYR